MVDTGFVRRTYSGANASPSVAALQRTTLVFAQASPYAVVLTGLKCPCKALFTNFAAATNDFRFLDLKNGRAGIADGEEKLRVFIQTCCAMAPIHVKTLLSHCVV